MLRLLRPRQWTKNLLLFAALVFAHRLFDAHDFALACLAFAAFCLASSSVYVINDLIDVERDRKHPTKKNRPIASGQVSRGAASARRCERAVQTEPEAKQGRRGLSVLASLRAPGASVAASARRSERARGGSPT